MEKSIAALLCLGPVGLLAGELGEPVAVEAGGEKINVEVGHAAPWVADMDDDGVQDLLVGQFGGGKLWMFRNVGSNKEPKLEKGVLVKAGGKDATVPYG
jgi:hypothetical protein